MSTPRDLPPLIASCPACHGTGTQTHPAWQAYFAATGGVLLSPQSADHPWPREPEEIPCPRCDGTCCVVTPAGWQVLSLLAHVNVPFQVPGDETL
jgi:hypothetical protein